MDHTIRNIEHISQHKIVLYTCRNLDNAGDLLTLRDAHPDTIVVKQLDITHYEKSFKEFVQDIKVGEKYFFLGYI